MNALLRLASTLDDYQFYSESDQIYNLYEDLSKIITSENEKYLIKTAEILDQYGRPYVGSNTKANIFARLSKNALKKLRSSFLCGCFFIEWCFRYQKSSKFYQ